MYRISLFALGLMASGAALAQAPGTNTRAALQKQIDQSFDKGDVNNNGFLSRAEVNSMAGQASQAMVERMEKEFATLDKDKNGQVSFAEFKAGATARLAGNAASSMDRLDLNKDGKVSPAEFRAPLLGAFDRADANKDGKLSPEEARKAQGR